MKVPSDLIVDVMQAADATRLQVAKARLAAIAGGQPLVTRFAEAFPAGGASVQEPSFAGSSDILTGVMNAADPQRRAAATTRLASLSETRTNVASAHPAKDPYQNFEGFLLRTAFEEILPAADSSTFGDGFAGGVWRSMAAEQFANLFADRGGIGIADALRNRIAADQARSQPVASGQWPYFSQTNLSAQT